VKKRYLRCLICFFLVWLNAMCFGQVITVRIINGRNGHPLPRRSILFSPLYDKSEKAPAKYDANVRMETDSNGEAQFNLPAPLPVRVSVGVGLDFEHWRCLCAAPLFVRTQDVIQKGIVEGSEFAMTATPLKAAPGQIVFVARPITLFERILSPLLRE
jgi:hypothetical protein